MSLLNSIGKNVTYSSILNKPNTLAGFGITNGILKDHPMYLGIPVVIPAITGITSIKMPIGSATLGPELITNQEFTLNGSGWILTGSWSFDTAQNCLACNVGAPDIPGPGIPITGLATYVLNVTAGGLYMITYDLMCSTAGYNIGNGLITASLGNVVGDKNTLWAAMIWKTAQSQLFRANVTGATTLTLSAEKGDPASATGFVYVDKVSVKQVISELGTCAIFKDTKNEYVDLTFFNTTNLGIGLDALDFCTVDAVSNLGIGSYALSSLLVGDNNIALGTGALGKITRTSDNIAIGTSSLGNNVFGYQNVAIGTNTLLSNTSGSCNVAIGIGSGQLNITGIENTSMGSWAALYNQKGNFNTSLGHGALHLNITGIQNTAFGGYTLMFSSEDANTALGWSAGSSFGSGVRNTFLGYHADSNVIAGTTYTGVVITNSVCSDALGLAAGKADRFICRASLKGIFIVGQAYYFYNDGARTTYRNLEAGDFNDTVTLEGTANDAYMDGTAIGYGAKVTASNHIQFGNSGTLTYAIGGFSIRSDARDKTNIRDTILGLNFIDKLRPVDFKWDYREDYDGKEKDGSKIRTRFHHGLIAQEVKAIIDDLGIDFGGYEDQKINGGSDKLGLNYDELLGPMIRAIQELNNDLIELKAIKGI